MDVQISIRMFQIRDVGKVKNLDVVHGQELLQSLKQNKSSKNLSKKITQIYNEFGKIKITFIVVSHKVTRNYSSAFNLSRLAPVEDTHAQGHTLMETDAIHWSGGQPITVPGEHGDTVL